MPCRRGQKVGRQKDARQVDRLRLWTVNTARSGRRTPRRSSRMAFCFMGTQLKIPQCVCIVVSGPVMAIEEQASPWAKRPEKGERDKQMDEFRKPILHGKGATDYERYLHTDELLSLQTSV